MNQRGGQAGLSIQTLMDGLDNMSIARETVPLTSAGLVIGTSSTAAVKIANTVTYKIFGKFYSKTTAEIAFTATAANNVANGFEQCWMLQLDTAGNGLLIPGTPVGTQGLALLPERPPVTLTQITAPITANAAAQTVPITTGGSPAYNGSGLVVGTVVLVDFGGQQESVTITAVNPGVSITGIFANNHPAGAIIQQTFCPIGSVRIYNNSGAVFTAGTTALSASGLTTTYTNGYPPPLFDNPW